MELVMPARKKVAERVQVAVLTESKRRCCVCFGLDGDTSVKRGQIAHLDANPSNNELENLAFLCLEHHDVFDSKTSQSKGLTIAEIKSYRNNLNWFLRDVSSEGLSALDGKLENVLQLLLDRAKGWYNELVDLIARAQVIEDSQEFESLAYRYGHSRKYVGDLVSISKVLSKHPQLSALEKELRDFLQMLTGEFVRDGHIGFP